MTLADAAAALLARLPAATDRYRSYPSGVVRLEAPLPRTATTALQWLTGQQSLRAAAASGTAGISGSASPAADGPFCYFSGRRSSAPDTPGAAAAEAATRGWSALAGAGAAWSWSGPAPPGSGSGSGSGGGDGGGFGAQAVAAMQRFLSADQPRVRVIGGVRCEGLTWRLTWRLRGWLTWRLRQVPRGVCSGLSSAELARSGGTYGLGSHPSCPPARALRPRAPLRRRFDPGRPSGPEWSAFGSHAFVLPLLELTEAEDVALLAVTLAWDFAAEAEAAAEEGGGGARGPGWLDVT